MEKARYLVYVGSVVLVFVVLTAIKMVLPHSEPKRPIDEIGMRLYRPIFFGETDASPEYEAASTEGEQETTPDILEKEEEYTLPKKKSIESKSSEDAYLTTLIAEYKSTVLSKRKYRNDVVVRYYKHEPDGDQARILVDYGFYIHERPIPDKSRFEDFGSNVIYYGKDFPQSDIKFIAALLINNGMGIKKIQPFKDFDGWKHKSIEIGANPKLDKKPVLTLSDIQLLNLPK